MWTSAWCLHQWSRERILLLTGFTDYVPLVEKNQVSLSWLTVLYVHWERNATVQDKLNLSRGPRVSWLESLSDFRWLTTRSASILFNQLEGFVSEVLRNLQMPGSPCATIIYLYIYILALIWIYPDRLCTFAVPRKLTLSFFSFRVDFSERSALLSDSDSAHNSSLSSFRAFLFTSVHTLNYMQTISPRVGSNIWITLKLSDEALVVRKMLDRELSIL